MFKKFNLWDQSPWIRRTLIVAFTCVAIFSSAASCSLFGDNNPLSDDDTIYGVLKKDPSVKADGFGKINAVELSDGETESQGLTNVSSLKLHQNSSDDLYLLTQDKGVFRTTNGGRSWERKYLYSIGDLDGDELEDAILENDSFIETDLIASESNPSTVYVSGQNEDEIGKIYKSTDGGETFKEVYTDIEEETIVKDLAISPSNNSEIYAALYGDSIIKSKDGGKTWKKIYQFDRNEIMDIGFYDRNKFFVVLEDDGLAISTGGEGNWEFPELVKTESEIGEDQGSGGFSIFGSSDDFDEFYKLIPASPAGYATTTDWLMIADNQIWHSSDLSTFRKMALPFGDENATVLDIEVDPIQGMDRIFVSVDDKLFETTNRGETWDTNDKIAISGEIGQINDILIDKYNTQVIYLTLGEKDD